METPSETLDLNKGGRIYFEEHFCNVKTPAEILNPWYTDLARKILMHYTDE